MDMNNQKTNMVLKKFVKYLSENGYPNLRVDGYPDEINRITPDIDVIAGPFAIEHTSIDTISRLRELTKWFEDIVGDPKEDFPNIQFRLNISFRYNAIKKGHDSAMIINALKNWIAKEAPLLNDTRQKEIKIPHVPFALKITKQSDRPPGVIYSRGVENDETFPIRFENLIRRKLPKLSKYKDEFITILLIENNDGLMDKSIMINSINKNFIKDILNSVDQFWYADTTFFYDVEFENITSDIRFA